MDAISGNQMPPAKSSGPAPIPKMMKAAKYDSKAANGISLWPVTCPKVATSGCLKPGKVLVRVKAAGVNPVDAKFLIGDKLPETWMKWSNRRMNGFVPGFDFSGVVVKSKDAEFNVGDEVFGLAADPAGIFLGGSFQGSFAEYAQVPVSQLVKKPSCITHAEAAALPLVGTTCIQAFQQHGLSKGQRLLVIGASGGVGHVAVQVAVAMGITVVGICSGGNFDFVRDCGASVVIDYSEGNVIDKLAQEASSNGRFDMVLDCVHSADSRDKVAGYYERVAGNGKIVKTPGINRTDKHNYVVLGGSTTQFLKAALKRFHLGNYFEKGFELFWINMPKSKDALKYISLLCEEDGLRPKIEQRLPFTQEGCQQAFASLQSRKTAGKIIIQIQSD